MTMRIALLRGVNVGGNRKVAMSELRDFMAGIGFADARTLLQSGNLVFTSEKGTEELERLLEREVEKRHGLRAEFFVRSEQEWRSLVAQNPFRDEARSDPAHLLAMLLKKEPDAAAIRALDAAIAGPERALVQGRLCWLVYPAGIANSRLTNVVIERKLGTTGTARNWNTVLKLEALAAARP